MKSTRLIARMTLLVILAFCCTMGIHSATAEEDASLRMRIEARNGSMDREVPVLLVQQRARGQERRYLKELEDYYDDLEDFYKDRDPALADYYESWEKYYEDVRKGKPAFMPPEIAVEGGRGAGPVLAPPGFVAPRLRIAVSNLNRNGPHTNLERSYRHFQRQLAGLTTGDTWLEYFQLPFDDQLASTPIDLLMTEESKAQFAKALERFDRIASDPEYRVVARLSAFGRTRNALRSFTQWLDRQPTLAEPEAVEGEEIPLPPPDPQPPTGGPILPPQ